MTVPGLPLTAYQVDILCRVANGDSAAEIGAALGIARGTVHVHMVHIKTKLCARTVPHAVMIALTTGVLALEGDDRAEDFDAQPAPGFPVGAGPDRTYPRSTS